MDAMIDIETLGTAPDALILSIGAVRFSLAERRVDEEHPFYVMVDARSQPMARVDGSTALWWFGQPDAVRLPHVQSTMHVRIALAHFTLWLRGEETARQEGEIQLLGLPPRRFADPAKGVWANGPTFDLAILRSAYRRERDEPAPWHYRDERCVRTLVRLARIAGADSRSSDEGRADRHDALADAIHQARYCIEAWKALQGGRP